MFPEEDRYYMTRSELLDRVSTLLGGRVAEKLVLNDISTGAQNDLERATQIVRQMIMEYGMSDSLGPITLGRKQDQVFLGRDLGRDRDYSEEIAKAIDQEIRKTIDDCYQRAQDILEEDRSELEKIAQALLEKETLNSEEIKALVEGREMPELEEDEAPEKADGNLEQEPAAESDSGTGEHDEEEISEGSHEEEAAETEEAGSAENEEVEEEKEDRRASFRQHTEQGENPGEDH